MRQTEKIWFGQNQNSLRLKIFKGVTGFDLQRDLEVIIVSN